MNLWNTEGGLIKLQEKLNINHNQDMDGKNVFNIFNTWNNGNYQIFLSNQT